MLFESCPCLQRSRSLAKYYQIGGRPVSKFCEKDIVKRPQLNICKLKKSSSCHHGNTGPTGTQPAGDGQLDGRHEDQHHPWPGVPAPGMQHHHQLHQTFCGPLYWLPCVELSWSIFQGSVLDSHVENLNHRLRGLCDNVDAGQEKFQEKEMVFSIRGTSTVPLTLRVRHSLDPNSRIPWQLRWFPN